MVVVKKRKGESDDKLIFRFKKKVINDKLIEEMRDRVRFESKAERRKKQKYDMKHRDKLKREKDY